MGISLTTVADGATMVSADLRTNLSTLRTYTNAGGVIGDYDGSSFTTRHFKRFDHHLGSVVREHIGTTGAVWELAFDTSLHHRVALHPSSHNMNAWQDISTFAIRYKLPHDANVDIEISWWAWAIQASAYTVPASVATAEYVNQCDFAPFLDGTVQAECQRTLHDSGSDSSAAQGGQYLYPARNYSVSARASVAAGRHGCRMKVNFRNTTTNTEHALVWVGARSMTILAEWK